MAAKENSQQREHKKIDSASRLGQFLDPNLTLCCCCAIPGLGRFQSKRSGQMLFGHASPIFGFTKDFFSYTESIRQTMQVFSLREDWLKVELQWYQEFRDFSFYAPISHLQVLGDEVIRNNAPTVEGQGDSSPKCQSCLRIHTRD